MIPDYFDVDEVNKDLQSMADVTRYIPNPPEYYYDAPDRDQAVPAVEAASEQQR